MSEPPADESLDRLLTASDFERAAKKALSPMAYDYYRSGADAQRTLRANRRAFRRYEIWPRVLVDVSALDLRVTVLGAEVAAPILVAPTAYHRLADPDGELATARAAAAAGTLFVASTLATTSIEDIAAASAGPKWFQLYVHKDRGFTRSLVERAQAAGYRAIVLTVDTPVLGRRLADVRNGFALPPGMAMANLPDDQALHRGPGAGSTLSGYVASRHDASAGWGDLGWLRSFTSLPLVLKGVLRVDDAERAVEHGIEGLIVSNHGARQLDGVPATLDALGPIASAVGGRCEVFLDSGVRWGTDVLKALALGARAVLVGRPVLWGLATFGQAGVERVLGLLREELERAMALSGCPRAAAVDGDLVRRKAARG
jgi:4-hydroxymandelate oxidase